MKTRSMEIVLPRIKQRNPLVMMAKAKKTCRHMEPTLDKGKQRRNDINEALRGA